MPLFLHRMRAEGAPGIPFPLYATALNPVPGLVQSNAVYFWRTLTTLASVARITWMLIQSKKGNASRFVSVSQMLLAYEFHNLPMELNGVS